MFCVGMFVYMYVCFYLYMLVFIYVCLLKIFIFFLFVRDYAHVFNKDMVENNANYNVFIRK